MKQFRLAASFAILLITAVPATTFAADQTFTATLTGDAEVPPVDTDATGRATVTIADGDGSISYEVRYEGLSGDAAASHIHFGARGEAGPVMIPLEVGDSPFSGTVESSAFQPVEGGPQTWAEALAAIRDGETYVNVHTAANPPGEIRGQLMGQPATDTSATPVGRATPVGVLLMLAVVGLISATLVVRRLARR